MTGVREAFREGFPGKAQIFLETRATGVSRND
jgi:hypothetical protein